MIGRLRGWYWRRLRRYRYEICRDCGRPVEQVWGAPDSLWLAIWGGPNGILCIPCFDARCRLRGIFVRFRVERL